MHGQDAEQGEAEVGENYRDTALPGQSWENRHFLRCDFTDADLRGLRTSGCTFTECDFTRVDLGESSHRAAAVRSCVFDRAVLSHSEWRGCTWLGSSFAECRLRPIVLSDTDLTLASLAHADLRTTAMVGLRFRETNLIGADLRGCDLRDADLFAARLLDTRLDNADLRGSKVDADGLVQAATRGATVDVELALAYAAAHGLKIDFGAPDAAS